MNKYKLSLAMMLVAFPYVNAMAEEANIKSVKENKQLAQNLNAMTVTATKLPRDIGDVAGTVTVITSEELEEQLAVDFDDLIRYQPGLSMDTSGRGGNQGVTIRGIGGNRVLTLIDGVRSNDIYSAGPASYGRDSLDVDDLKQLEIIRGPSSVLYGADALGGVVLLETKDPEDYLKAGETTYFSVRSSGSSANDEVKAGFTGAVKLGDMALSAQYTRRDFNEKEIEGPGELNAQDGQTDSLLLKSVWTPNDRHRFKLALDFFNEAIDYHLDNDLSASVTASKGNDETERHRVSLHHDWTVNSIVADSINSQLFWQKTDALQHTLQERTSFSFPFAPFGTTAIRDTDFDFNQEIKGFNATLVKSFEAGNTEHALVYGVNYELTESERPRNRCETALVNGIVTCDILAFPFSGAESFPNKTFPDTDTTRAGIFVQDEITLGESGFTVIPGIRYDYYEMDPDLTGVIDIAGFSVDSLTENELSKNLGVIYDVNDQVALFAQYSEGFRPPSFDESNQSFVNLNFNYALVPNPGLKPETSKGLELGIKTDLDNGYFSFAIFDNRYEDFIDTQFVGNSGGLSLYQERNISKARIYGAEFTGHVDVTESWSVHTAIAYARGDDKEANNPLDSVDPLTGVLGVAYAGLNDQWSVESTLTLVDEKNRVSAKDRVTSSGYGLVDVFGKVKLSEQVTLRLGVFNVFNKQYARWSNLKGRAANSGDIDSVQESGTELRTSINYQF